MRTRHGRRPKAEVVAAVTSAPLDVATALAAVCDPRAGAIASFVGTIRVRNAGRLVVSLSYEACLTMAERELQRLATAAHRRWRLVCVQVRHRIGTVPVGEPSVVIAVSAAHRASAFAACRWLIESLKKDVPIWKLERHRAGATWIGAAALRARRRITRLAPRARRESGRP